ncbi:hypothetical protein PybrP1_006376 [[Pythium] brassicae (nom. inval.)]|nr:hypothetical protein PybrP1_006376 [[Pythium] brassicae (nom. inval.)]
MNGSIGVGFLALLGPRQVPSLSSLQYVRVRAINGAVTTVVVVGPDVIDANSEELTLKTAMVQRRAVLEDESSSWPGKYVGHPVAFVTPSGPHMDLWSYGAVTEYTQHESSTSLNISTEASTVALELFDATPLIKADRLDHALQTIAGISSVPLNAAELLDLQDEVCAVGAKRRFTSVPANLRRLLSTLERRLVRRQHVVRCVTGPAKKRKGDTFLDTQKPRRDDTSAVRGKKWMAKREPSPSSSLRRRAMPSIGSVTASDAAALGEQGSDASSRRLRRSGATSLTPRA